jgi:outer membrane protein insertion porin family
MHQRFIRTQLSALVVGLALAVNASADDSRFVVKDIRLEGLMRVSPANIYAQLPLSNGDTVDSDKIASAIRALFKSGNFEDVTSERDGDVLIFKVTERPAIATIKISGNKVIDSDTLTKALKDAGLVEGSLKTGNLRPH